jgi:hypothetical protein
VRPLEIRWKINCLNKHYVRIYTLGNKKCWETYVNAVGIAVNLYKQESEDRNLKKQKNKKEKRNKLFFFLSVYVLYMTCHIFGKELKHTVFVTSAIDGVEFSASCSDWFVSFVRHPGYALVRSLGKPQNLPVHGGVIIIITLAGN